MNSKRIFITSTVLAAGAFLGFKGCSKTENKPEQEIVTYAVQDSQKEDESEKEPQTKPVVETKPDVQPSVTYTYVYSEPIVESIPVAAVPVYSEPEPVQPEPQIPQIDELTLLHQQLAIAKAELEDAKALVEVVNLIEVTVEETDEEGNIILDEEGNAKSHIELQEERIITTKGDVETAQARVDEIQSQIDAISATVGTSEPDPVVPEVDEEENYTYTQRGEGVVITKYIGSDTVVEIPETLEDKPVTDISYGVFQGTEVEEIIVPDSITKIGSPAFASADSLETVTLPEDMITLTNSLFFGDKNLKNVNYSDHLASIGQGAFMNCSSLETIEIPDTVIFIGMGAFSGCSSLNEAVIPEGVTMINGNLFSNCTSLENVQLSSQTNMIGMNAFNNCISLTEVTLPSTVTLIDWNAFANCIKLNDIYFQGTKAQWDSIMVRPGSLPQGTTVHYLNEPVASEGDFEFIETSNGIIITKYIGTDTDVSIPETLRDKTIVALDENAFAGNSTVENVTVLSKAVSIGASCFEGCSNLRSISLPETIETIGLNAFKDCVALKDFVMPDHTNVIEDHAFENCSSLVKMVIKEGVTKVGDYALYGCSSLNALTLPNSMESLGEHSIDVGKQLQYVYYNGTTDEFLEIERGVGALRNVRIVCQNQWNDASDFEYTINGESVTITKYIGESDTVYIPNKIEGKLVTMIGDRAFMDSTVKIVVMPYSVTSLGMNAFNSCRYLSTIVLPNTITAMGMNTFATCSSLRTVELPLSIKEIPFNCFSDCELLKNVYIPEGVKLLGLMCFNNTSSLTELKLPSTVEQIAFSAFQVSGIQTINIPVSVKRIDNFAFAHTENLTDIYYEGTAEQWSKITLGMRAIPTNVTIHTIDN